MSNPQPASASYGGSPQTYIPTAQPAGDVSYQNLLGFGSGAGGGLGAAASQIPGVNPAYLAYQQAAGLYPSAAYNANNYLINSGAVPGMLAGAQTGSNYFNQTVAPALSGAPGALAGSANQVLNTGFDPQQALYNQQSGQARDAANVANAGAGISGTPYGASVAANAQNNFNLNWQNQQLARQQQALQSAGAGFTNAGNVGQGLTQGYAQAGALPYTAGTTIGNNALSGVNSLQSILSGQANLGGQSFALPQQVLNDLQSYLQLGQAAQQQGLVGGQQGFNQLAGGIGGGIGAANTFLNPSSGIFPNALSGIGSGIGGLFGSAGGLSAADAAAFLPGGTTAGLSAADLATFLPAFR